MLIFSMSVSLDGFINDRDGGIGWSSPSDEQFRYSLDQVGGLGGYLLGRRLYEMMLPWEDDPSMRATELGDAFADVWCALPKVVFSRTLARVEGSNTRLAQGSVADEVAATTASTDKDVSIGGADVARQAFDLALVDELHLVRHPTVIGGGTPALPPVTQPVPWSLVGTRTFGSQVVYERYGRRPS